MRDKKRPDMLGDEKRQKTRLVRQDKWQEEKMRRGEKRRNEK